MKIVVFCSEKDNVPIFEQRNKETYFEIKYIEEKLTMDNVVETRGYDGILINTLCIITDEIANELSKNGVKYIASRAAGKDHMQTNILNKYGLKAANVPSYSPNAISELTIFMILDLLRHMNSIQKRMSTYNFSTDNLCGKELKSMTVGVIGCGNIGLETIRILNGFNSKVLVLNGRLKKKNSEIVVETRTEKDSVLQYASYADLRTIQKTCDIIIFHMPLTNESYHIIDKDFINNCKDGVILVNMARGGLFDAKDILIGIENQKISGFAFDVYEGEERFICKQASSEKVNDGVIEKLLQKNNVIYTPHIGYFTQEAIRAMIVYSLDNLQEFYETGNCKNCINV